MKTLKFILALIVLLSTPAFAQEMGTSSGHDLDALWARAQKSHDLSREDAVLLLESRTVTVGDEGTLVTRIHRVVWVGTSLGIRSYADLRVPWNSATSTLDVEILRTWMDGRWWPDARLIGETAVVHTLPHALNYADDYTAMRETMLLHDGVELPCIMETAYTIAEQGPPTAGADGVFVIPQRDPAMHVEYTVRVPAGIDVDHESLNGAPKPESDENGVHSLTWTMEDVPALKLPIASQPAAYEPAVVWSTWEDRETMDSVWWETIDAAAVVDSSLASALDERLAGSLDPVRDTVAFWNESVRTIHYPYRFWQLAPRPAARTWETGYGHVLDRAVLLNALMLHVASRYEGNHWTSHLIIRTEPGYGEVARNVPRLNGFDELRIAVNHDHLGQWLIDPDSGEILPGAETGRWRNPLCGVIVEVGPNDWHLALSLAPGDAETWHGSGVLRFRDLNGQAVWGDAVALEQRTSRAVESILPGAEVSAICAISGELRFTVDLAEWPTNPDDEPTLTVGGFAGGLMDNLPADIHLYESSRQSPLRIPTGHVETVELRIKVDDREVRTPEPINLAGPTGSFSVEVSREHGWLRVAQRLSLAVEDGSQSVEPSAPKRFLHPATSWPQLRALLLEASDPVHGTIVLE